MAAPEGSTPADADGLKLPVYGRADINAVEAANVLKAYRLHLGRRKPADARWLDETFLRRAHHDMLGDVWDWAGTYRRTALNLGVQPSLIVEQLGRLLGDVRYWQDHPDSMPVLERAVRLHHGLVRIHPFKDGNGRHSRLVADVYLHSQRHRLPEWPADLSAEGETRDAYLKGLRAADRGDFQELVSFVSALLPPA